MVIHILLLNGLYRCYAGSSRRPRDEGEAPDRLER